MRAATAIVGAIAAASILVALSLIVSGGGDSGQTVVTKTVIEKVGAPEAKETAEAPEAEGETGGAQFGGPTPCDSELSVENTSCEVGEQVHADYVKGERGELSAKDGETGATLTLSCKDETAPVTCSDDEGAVVYFEP